MPDVTLTLSAPTREYRSCPLTVALEPARLPSPDLILTDESGVTIPCQVEPAQPQSLLHFILPHIAMGQTKRLTLTPAHSASSTAPADCAPQECVQLTSTGEDKINVLINGEFFTAYHFGTQWSKPFLHPVLGPSGAVTRKWPMDTDPALNEKQDHVHHKGCWVAWGDVNGVDIWGEAREFGRQVHQRVIAKDAGRIVARLATLNRWVDAQRQPLLEDEREYRFYNLPSGSRVFDLTVRLRAGDQPVKLGDTKEGGICSVRVATSMDAEKAGTFINAHGGVKENEGWGKRSPWCDYFGPVGTQIAGIAIFDHPTNFRHPTYWHVRNYGLMTANPFGLSFFLPPDEKSQKRDGSHTLPAHTDMVFRYRVFVHAGDTHQARVAEQYHHWVNPPTVKVS